MLGGSGGGKGTWRRTVEGEKKWIRWSNQAEEGQQRASVMEGLPLSPASLPLSLSQHFSLKSLMCDVVTGCQNSNSTRTLDSPTPTPLLHCALTVPEPFRKELTIVENVG